MKAVDPGHLVQIIGGWRLPSTSLMGNCPQQWHLTDTAPVVEVSTFLLLLLLFVIISNPVSPFSPKQILQNLVPHSLRQQSHLPGIWIHQWDLPLQVVKEKEESFLGFLWWLYVKEEKGSFSWNPFYWQRGGGGIQLSEAEFPEGQHWGGGKTFLRNNSVFLTRPSLQHDCVVVIDA